MKAEQETRAAMDLLVVARHWAYSFTNPNSPRDEIDAATVAILMKAFELATQDLTVERRNKLLQGEWE